MTDCEKCSYNYWDEITNQNYCDLELDEDEYARLHSSSDRDCPYFNPYDEYGIVRHQI